MKQANRHRTGRRLPAAPRRTPSRRHPLLAMGALLVALAALVGCEETTPVDAVPSFGTATVSNQAYKVWPVDRAADAAASDRRRRVPGLYPQSAGSRADLRPSFSHALRHAEPRRHLHDDLQGRGLGHQHGCERFRHVAVHHHDCGRADATG